MSLFVPQRILFNLVCTVQPFSSWQVVNASCVQLTVCKEGVYWNLMG